MHCQCCNAMLSDYEATIKNPDNGQYYDLCMECLSDISEEVPLLYEDNKTLLLQEYNDQDLDNL